MGSPRREGGWHRSRIRLARAWPWGALGGQLFGLTGLGDRTTIAAFTTATHDEQQTLQVGTIYGSAARASPSAASSPTPGRAPIGAARRRDRFAHPLRNRRGKLPVRSPAGVSLRGSLGLDIIDQDIEFNTIPLNRDRLRIAFVRADLDALGLVPGDPGYTLAAPRWRLSATAELRRGLDIFGSLDGCGPGLVNCLAPGVVPPTRFEGDPDAFVARGAVYGELRPAPSFTIALVSAGNGERSAVQLREFSAGNYRPGDGYDPARCSATAASGSRPSCANGSHRACGAHGFRLRALSLLRSAWVWNETCCSRCRARS